jgi:hypothetical protein
MLDVFLEKLLLILMDFLNKDCCLTLVSYVLSLDEEKIVSYLRNQKPCLTIEWGEVNGFNICRCCLPLLIKFQVLCTSCAVKVILSAYISDELFARFILQDSVGRFEKLRVSCQHPVEDLGTGWLDNIRVNLRNWIMTQIDTQAHHTRNGGI